MYGENSKYSVGHEYNEVDNAIIFHGSCLDFSPTIPDKKVKLIVTSPPYNIGKKYEKKSSLDQYYEMQEQIIDESVRILSDDGSICWQVGNYINNSEIIPLDVFLYPIFQKHNLKLRNRIIWTFGHGLHAKKRFSGRYETVLWFTKSDNYTFNLDNVRIPQKYPNKKHFKGKKIGHLSCNPLGKNPADIWEIPNVKSNHVEKTLHPCQFPVALVERLVLALTNEYDLIYDPFMRVGTSLIAALKNKRRGMGAEIIDEYVLSAMDRIRQLGNGTLKTRPINKPVYEPDTPLKNLNYEKETLFI
ncbi:MAG: site-specific DNA-methyltransferase [Spirochaeta sp. LUC14_002_19_P3]|nr:MAG: site-specific DNA-methyltransferase [Spirochaeta sp. LUC14_002_19_P3]